MKRILLAVGVSAVFALLWYFATSAERGSDDARRAPVPEGAQAAPVADDSAQLADAGAADVRRALDDGIAAALAGRTFAELLAPREGLDGAHYAEFGVRCFAPTGERRDARAADVVRPGDLASGGLFIVSAEGACPRWFDSDVLRAALLDEAATLPLEFSLATAGTWTLSVAPKPDWLPDGTSAIERVDVFAEMPHLLPNSRSNCVRYPNQKFDAYANFARDLRELAVDELSADAARERLERVRAVEQFAGVAGSTATMPPLFVEPWTAHAWIGESGVALDRVIVPLGFSLVVFVWTEARVAFEGVEVPADLSRRRRDNCIVKFDVADQHAVGVGYEPLCGLTWTLPEGAESVAAECVTHVPGPGGRGGSYHEVRPDAPDDGHAWSRLDLLPGRVELRCAWRVGSDWTVHRSYHDLEAGEVLDLGQLGATSDSELTVHVHFDVRGRVDPSAAVSDELRDVAVRLPMSNGSVMQQLDFEATVRDGDVFVVRGLPVGGLGFGPCALVEANTEIGGKRLRCPDTKLLGVEIVGGPQEFDVVIPLEFSSAITLEVRIPKPIARTGLTLQSVVLPHGSSEYIDVREFTWGGDGAGGGFHRATLDLPLVRATVFTRFAVPSVAGDGLEWHTSLVDADPAELVDGVLPIDLVPAATLQVRASFLVRSKEGQSEMFRWSGGEWLAMLLFAEHPHYTANPFGTTVSENGYVLTGLPPETDFVVRETQLTLRTGPPGSTTVID